jgi:hypothetical protein
MKYVLIFAGAGALIFAGPVLAKPGQGHGHGNPHGNAYGVNGPVGYGVGGCPPGLAKKGCVPPGQAKKLYRVGQRYNMQYGTPWEYRDIPYDVRRHYGFDANDRYYYGDGYIYRVNPRTMLVRQAVLAALYP